MIQTKYLSQRFLDFSKSLLILISFLGNSFYAKAVQDTLWHNQQRTIHYQPEGENFVCINGERKFNRALYGTNTAFRTEAGDLPEFALYMPGMGGNLKFGIINNQESKWLSSFATIKAIYKPGSMLYEVQDPILGSGKIFITILSRANSEGLILQLSGENLSINSQLIWAFGGATGKKFSRDGDIGADPESVFYLHPENCLDNNYTITENGFNLKYGSGKIAPTPAQRKTLNGVFPKGDYVVNDANCQKTPSQLWDSKSKVAPVFTGKIIIKNKESYFFSINNPENDKVEKYSDLSAVFNQAEQARLALANRIIVKTPDSYINTLGGALAMAADAIWETPTYLHGAVAWRMRLNAWRGAYAADVLGWHDRARLHLSSYANSQVLEPQSGPIVPDTSRNFARQEETMGTSMFSSGYISRNPNANNKPHHYDMNLVFFDQMFNYFNWTGDIAFLKEMWPVLERHLAWEKRNFDSDGDGLYDAYAAIWASDALQYSGGGVTHTSAYNFRANTEMARLAVLIRKDPKPYQQEADHISKALQEKLWLPKVGVYAEYKDLLGNQLLHQSPGLWTIYHTIDSKVPDHFQAYQALQYVDHQIPHIPIAAKGLKDNGYYTLSTTNWQPYTWSVNNVALAELLHTSLAYWQGGQDDEAFKLWKSSLIESMYLGASPGNFQQLSYYDAVRGELYRDFADPIGMAGRSLVEGLFGVHPDALNNKLVIHPGLPSKWDFASLKVPDIAIDFKRADGKDTYLITPSFTKEMALTMQLKAYKGSVKSLKVNGLAVAYTVLPNAINQPEIEFTVPYASNYTVEIAWEGNQIDEIKHQEIYTINSNIELNGKGVVLISVFDPQQILNQNKVVNGILKSSFKNETGFKTVFAQLKQNDFTWWQAINFKLVAPLTASLVVPQTANQLSFNLHNNGEAINGTLMINAGKNAFEQKVTISAQSNQVFNISNSYLLPGSNAVKVIANDKVLVDTVLINWNIEPSNLGKLEKIDLSKMFNADLTQIFKQKYLSPRPNAVTLQLPTQGIGNWCYPLINPEIDDSGLRKAAGEKQEFLFKNKIPFATPSASGEKNIAFTSQWDNYPKSIQIPVKGKAKHAYFLMAGSTNHMQSRMENAKLMVNYTDGTSTNLSLKNPQNWWPIDQDYEDDGYAFTTDAPKPPRLYLKKGEVIANYNGYKGIKGFSDNGIEGGAATILDLPLDDQKTIKNITLNAIANDVVVGLMAITLER